jgi:hypothetical protein
MLRIRADRGAGIAQFAWINFQKDGSISIGLTDRAFIPPDMNVYHGVWSAFNRQAIQYIVAHDPKALKQIGSPHLTFHPPAVFHLTKGKGKKPFFGIADVDLTVRQDGWMPWAKIVSKPVSKLSDATKGRAGKMADDLILPVCSGEYSMGLSINFLDPKRMHEVTTSLTSRIVTWHGRSVAVTLEALPPQHISTISWVHQY